LISNEKFNFSLLTILVSLKRIERGPYNKVMDISDQTKNYKRIPHPEEKRKQDHKPELSGLNDSNGHTHVP
jgi:hypothetical protein